MSAYTAAALALPSMTGCSAKPIDIAAQPFFFSHIVDAKTIMQAGQAYRKTNKSEDDKNKLKDLLLANSVLPAKPDDKVISGMLANKVNNDFKTGKIAVING